MKKIVVTGYTGFVGSNLMPYLINEGFEVIGLGRTKPAGQSFAQFTYDELPQITGYDTIVHLAGKAHDLKKTADDQAYFEVNTDLTIKLFSSFLQSEASTFIYMSSVKAAADTVNGILLETDKPEPKTPYGQSKLKAEEFLLNAALPEGKRVIILRPCMIHGPGNKGNLNLLYQFVKKGIPYPLAAFQNKRSLLSINNLLFVIKAIIDKNYIVSGCYNVADDEPLATSQIIDVLAAAQNIRPKKWAINAGLIKSIAKTGDVLRLPLNSERLKKLTESYLVSNDKIKAAIGVDQMPQSATDGLTYTALNL
ncbi:NAD-dependent epimerase/dehydratase family protein [Mucilaginibacter celer]|uniref:NAD-dependent epimerase/dehydratase family protein n=1 Tax=Mucilaginibacter celer TaxID=2305508 RepID=A0A494W3W7_9SPHI|nr:NAD-dependent epimerase/dehydratase family protein [Mucilaginibacter celer]AYL98433.1 NAD-dependent epimerase/dehydratase family protein [Mucilaginibacter celer]